MPEEIQRLGEIPQCDAPMVPGAATAKVFTSDVRLRRLPWSGRSTGAGALS